MNKAQHKASKSNSVRLSRFLSVKFSGFFSLVLITLAYFMSPTASEAAKVLNPKIISLSPILAPISEGSNNLDVLPPTTDNSLIATPSEKSLQASLIPSNSKLKQNGFQKAPESVFIPQNQTTYPENQSSTSQATGIIIKSNSKLVTDVDSDKKIDAGDVVEFSFTITNNTKSDLRSLILKTGLETKDISEPFNLKVASSLNMRPGKIELPNLNLGAGITKVISFHAIILEKEQASKTGVATNGNTQINYTSVQDGKVEIRPSLVTEQGKLLANGQQSQIDTTDESNSLDSLLQSRKSTNTNSSKEGVIYAY